LWLRHGKKFRNADFKNHQNLENTLMILKVFLAVILILELLFDQEKEVRCFCSAKERFVRFIKHSYSEDVVKFVNNFL